MKRLFFALWPDMVTRQQCAEIQTLLPHDNYKLTSIHNMHVTLVFLGSVNLEAELALHQIVAKMAIPDTSLAFDHLSYWRQPEILCLRSSFLDPKLAEFVAQLSTLAQQLGIVLDERPYKAHITLARKAKQAVAIEFSPVILQVQEFCLVESCSSANGVEYQVLKSWGRKKQA